MKVTSSKTVTITLAEPDAEALNFILKVVRDKGSFAGAPDFYEEYATELSQMLYDEGID